MGEKMKTGSLRAATVRRRATIRLAGHHAPVARCTSASRYGAAVCLAVSLVLSSCSGAASYLDVMQANSAFRQRRYQDAIVAYFRALKRGRSVEWIQYDLGNVYYRLGEEGVADETWRKAADSKTPEVQYRSWFNRGVLAYETGDYDAAAEAFKKALELNGSSLDAKVNLEMSLRNRNRHQARSAQQPSPVERKNSPQAFGNLLEFLSRKEHDRWKSQTRRQDDTDVNDY